MINRRISIIIILILSPSIFFISKYFITKSIIYRIIGNIKILDFDQYSNKKILLNNINIKFIVEENKNEDIDSGDFILKISLNDIEITDSSIDCYKGINVPKYFSKIFIGNFDFDDCQEIYFQNFGYKKNYDILDFYIDKNDTIKHCLYQLNNSLIVNYFDTFFNTSSDSFYCNDIILFFISLIIGVISIALLLTIIKVKLIINRRKSN